MNTDKKLSAKIKMRKTTKSHGSARGKRAICATLAGALALATFASFATACSSGPKVYHIGNSGSRVTIQQAD